MFESIIIFVLSVIIGVLSYFLYTEMNTSCTINTGVTDITTPDSSSSSSSSSSTTQQNDVPNLEIGSVSAFKMHNSTVNTQYDKIVSFINSQKSLDYTVYKKFLISNKIKDGTMYSETMYNKLYGSKPLNVMKILIAK
jgi:hypothetical protein